MRTKTVLPRRWSHDGLVRVESVITRGQVLSQGAYTAGRALSPAVRVPAADRSERPGKARSASGSEGRSAEAIDIARLY
jgi:hypothetical protein